MADHRVYEQDTAVEVAVVVANDDDSLVARHGTQPLVARDRTTTREIMRELACNREEEVLSDLLQQYDKQCPVLEYHVPPAIWLP